MTLWPLTSLSGPPAYIANTTETLAKSHPTQMVSPNASTSISTFLSLPAELRLRIYDYIGPTTQPSLFTGLLLTCRAIYNELEPELCKAIAREVEKIVHVIRADGDEILYTPPTTLHGWLNLTVSRPKRANMFNRRDPYLQFKSFFLHTFTITFHNHAEGFEFRSDRPDTYQAAARRLAAYIGMCYKTDHFPAMRKWRLDWSAYPQKDVGMIKGGPLFLYKREGWEMVKDEDEAGLLMGVTYRKVQMAAEDRSEDSSGEKKAGSRPWPYVWQIWNPSQIPSLSSPPSGESGAST